jgi:hypothetical protein
MLSPIPHATALVLILCSQAGFAIAAEAAKPTTIAPAAAKQDFVDHCTTEIAPGHAHAWQMMAAVHMYILSHSDSSGAFQIADNKGERLLDFIEIRQPVLRSKSNGQYLVSADFRGSDGQHYSVDFWLNQQNKNLDVKDVRIHEASSPQNGADVLLYDPDRKEFDVIN